MRTIGAVKHNEQNCTCDHVIACIQRKCLTFEGQIISLMFPEQMQAIITDIMFTCRFASQSSWFQLWNLDGYILNTTSNILHQRTAIRRFSPAIRQPFRHFIWMCQHVFKYYSPTSEHALPLPMWIACVAQCAIYIHTRTHNLCSALRCKN